MDRRLTHRFAERVVLGLVFLSCHLFAQRVPVLNQIRLPHSYYYRELYLPQLTSGPSSVTWSPDGRQLIYSMQGSLWLQDIDSDTAIQLTDDNGYDYQPDWSPDGSRVIFTRYNGSSCELMLLSPGTGTVTALTNNQAVNVEPRWSPDGSRIVFVSTENTGHFLLYMARVIGSELAEISGLTPDQKSKTARYYYSAYDHAINPAWHPDGRSIYFISNNEIGHGTGDIMMMDVETKRVKTIHREETNWRTRPDISPDGTRMVYSSYLGRNWHQLWLLPAVGGYPVPLTYGEYDNTAPRWSPDGKRITFISNRNGNTSLWLINVFDGGLVEITAKALHYKNARTRLVLYVRDENNRLLPARVSITDSRGKFYAPHNRWIHADDSRYPATRHFETHYFHTDGVETVSVPNDRLSVQVSHGPEYELIKTEVDARQGLSGIVDIRLKKLAPENFDTWWSGDVHVHMNYGGHYKNTPANLIRQAEAENLNFVFNLIVNKEQRIPDVGYFSPAPDPASTEKCMLLHAQEFHTSFWGHLGLLNLKHHLILPDYSGYPQTAVESLYPHNGFIADRAHEQQALVGYVHPFEQAELFPEQASTLFNALPVDVALGKVDYYELIGFSDHKASEAVWYELLNAGFRLPAAAGTDAMANYASLRGPVGLNRVYVKGEGKLDQNTFLQKLSQGKSFVTNGPLIGLTVNGKNAGDSIRIHSKEHVLSYTAFLRSYVPVDYVELIWNGQVVHKHNLSGGTTADVKGSVKVKGSGWLLLRAWSQKAHPDLPDIYPYASTNPVYITSPLPNTRQKTAAQYFLKWVNRIEAKAHSLPYRTDAEKEAVLQDIKKAKLFYQNMLK